ncbi:MAG: hypothetical protein AB7Q17_17885 [Phycisphaerae bacterium]
MPRAGRSLERREDPDEPRAPVAPPLELDQPPAPRRSGWRRLARWAVWASVAVAVALVGSYWYYTRPGRIRSAVESTFHRLGLVVARLDAASFLPPNSVELSGLLVASAGAGPAVAGGPAAEPLVHVGFARITCEPWALLRGEFRVTDILVQNATATILRDAETGVLNWPLRVGPPPSDRGSATRVLPNVRIESVDLQLMMIEHGRHRLARRWVLQGAAAPQPADAAGRRPYQIRVTRTAGATFGAATPRAPAFLELTWNGSTAELRSDWLDVETVALLLPEPAAQQLRGANMRGSFAVEQLSLLGQDVRSATIRVANLGAAVPVEAGLPPDERFLQLSDFAVTLRYDAADGAGLGTRLTLDANGRLNGAATRATLGLRARPLSDPAAALAPAAADGDAPPPWWAPLAPAGFVFDVDLGVTGIHAPTHDRNAALLESTHLPRGMRAFFADYQPRGVANVSITARGGARAVGGRLELDPGLTGECLVDPQGLSLVYYRFPYPIDTVHGRLRISPDGLDLINLHGRHGSARIRADGHVNHPSPWTGFRVGVFAQHAPLDLALYNALPPRYRAVWDQHSPTGLVDLNVLLEREDLPAEGPLRPPDVHVDAHLLSGAVSTGDGLRLTCVDGRLSFGEGPTVIHDLQGFVGESGVRLRASLTGPAADGQLEGSVQIEACDVPLAQAAALPAAGPASASELSFAGVGDVWGRRRADSSFSESRSHYAVHVRDGQLTSPDRALVWTDARGWIARRDAAIDVIGLAARRGDGELRLSGTLPTARDDSAPAVDMHVRDPQIDRVIAALTPPRWRAAVHELGIHGSGQVVARLRPGDAGAETGSTEIEIESQGARPAFLPLDLRGLRAHATLQPDGFRIHGASAAYGALTQLRLDGHGEWGSQLDQVEFELTASDLDLTADFTDAMPEPLALLLRRVAPAGRANLRFDRVRFERRDGPRWQIDGAVAIERAALRVGLALTDCSGELAGTCTIGPTGRAELNASFVVPNGRLAGRAIENVAGQLLTRSDDRWLHLQDLRGNLCGGDVVGFARIDADTSEYELSLVLRAVDLDAFLQRSPSPNRTGAGGTLDGNVFLRGVAGADQERRGGGEFRISGTSFLKSPVLAGIASAAEQERGHINEALDLANIQFLWQGHEIQLTRVEILSRDLRLVGSGVWDLRSDRIELTLVGANPSHWPRIAVLSDLVESAGQELLQYRVDGTLAQPRVTAEPLHSLTEPIRKLLRDER